MLTQKELETLDQAWEILNKYRNCKDFNESHDLTVGDSANVISDFLDWYENQVRKANRKGLKVVHFEHLESFQKL